MAPTIEVGEKRRTQVRRKGDPAVSNSRQEGRSGVLDSDGQKLLRNGGFADDRRTAEFTICRTIERYGEEVGKLRPIGRSKDGPLAMRTLPHPSPSLRQRPP